MLTESVQEVLALAIVALTLGVAGFKIFRGKVAGPLARWCLKRGRVKQAMWLRKQELAARGKCDH